MTAFVTRRLLGAIPLLLLVSFVSYALMGLAPGGPGAILGEQAQRLAPAARAHFIAQLGLDKPWYVQYFFWLVALGHGSLGYSFVDGRPVLDKILERLPITLALLSLALIVTIAIALPVGVQAAVARGSWFDALSSAAAFAAYATPVFWLGIVLVDAFAVHLRWLPASGTASLGDGGIVDRLRHLVLPVAALSLVSFAAWMRYERSAMIEALAAPFVRTARAKGLSERAVVYRHALRNALLPMITLLGLTLPNFVGGAYFVEYVFSLPGMGLLGINSVFSRDYPTVMGITLLSAIVVVLGNLLADVLYSVADPRIRYD